MGKYLSGIRKILIVLIFVSMLVTSLVQSESIVTRETSGSSGGEINSSMPFVLEPAENISASIIVPQDVIMPVVSPINTSIIPDDIMLPAKQKFLDPNVLDAFNNNATEVEVIVYIFDDTNITISRRDLPEKYRILLQERTDKLKRKTQALFSRIQTKDLEVHGMFISGKGFYGNVTLQLYNQLARDSDVQSIYLDGVSHISLAESRPLINADAVENLGLNGSGESACVVDTGIDYRHHYLGDGCFDTPGCKVRAGYNYIYGNSDPLDDNGHGTHVAGIIASESPVYRGIAPGASLIAMKACDINGDCNEGAIANSLDFCAFARDLYNISVVSLSFASNTIYNKNCTGYADTALADLYNAGIPVVAASGNGGSTSGIGYPACAVHVISVGATYDANLGRQPPSPFVYNGSFCYDNNTRADNITCFTNRKPGVLDLLAPGCQVTSTKLNGAYITECGTSQAAPMVAGTILLMRELNKSLSPEQLKTIMQNTGKTIGAYKRVDTLAAIKAIKDSDSDGYNATSYGGNDCNDNDASVHPGATEICDGKDNNCDGTVDEGCSQSPSCSQSGYASCLSSTYGDSTVSFAFNYYSNNNIRWGFVNGSNMAYTIGNYSIGWSAGSAKYMYYNIANPHTSCSRGGCTGGTLLSSVGTLVSTTSPAIASISTLVAYQDTANSWSAVWENPYSPYFYDNTTHITYPVYVLNCFQDSDCNSGNYCNKTGIWSTWSCVSKSTLGQSCSKNIDCQSNLCDSDGVGLADDNWCINGSSAPFDSQENNFCEYSTGSGIVDCDERHPSDSLSKCTIVSYYQVSCSANCTYQNIANTFDCNDAGCSCVQPLCQGLTTASNITTCSSDQPYFADKCSSTASGIDRGDAICRSSTFATGCTADTQCNGVVAGTGSCSPTCTYAGANASISISLLQPIINTNVLSNSYFNVTTQICCRTANCGTVQASLDPIAETPVNVPIEAINTDEYSYTSEKHCKDGVCTTIYYAFPHFGYEDNTWKPLEKLRSFRNTTSIECQVESDGIHLVECVDYNYTSRRLRIHVLNNSYTNVLIPIRTVPKGIINNLSHNQSSIIKYIKINKTTDVVDQWFKTGFHEEVHVGENSTIITYVPINASFFGAWNATSGRLTLFNWTNCAGNNYSASDINSISDGNSSTSIYGQGGGNGNNYTYCHWMRWQINETPSQISSIMAWAYWAGSLNAGADTITKSFYIGNVTGQNWKLLDSQVTGGSANHTGTVNASISDFVKNVSGKYYVYLLLHYNATKANSTYAYSNFYDTQLQITTGNSSSSGYILINKTYRPNSSLSFNGSWKIMDNSLAMYNWTNCNGQSYTGSDITSISDSTSATKIYASDAVNSANFSFCHWMKWQINESPTNINQIWVNAHWFGDLHDGSDSQAKSVYIGNVNSRSWELISQTMTGDTLQIGNVSGNISKYVENVNGKYYVYVLLHFNATRNAYSNGSYTEIYDAELDVTVNSSTSGLTPKGLISTVDGDTPFYTNGSNPLNISLGVNQCQNIIWWVNATGAIGTTYTFFAFANMTNNRSINNQTALVNITITSNSSGPTLLANYTFTSSNEGFTLNNGWTWDSGAGILRYNGSDYGGNLISPNISLSQYKNGYSIILVFASGNITNTKFYINSPSNGLAGDKYNFELQNDTYQHFKHDSGNFTQTDNYADGIYQTLRISVNLSENTTQACHDGGTCSSKEGMATYTPGDYFGIVPGVINGKNINITTIEVWRIG